MARGIYLATGPHAVVVHETPRRSKQAAPPGQLRSFCGLRKRNRSSLCLYLAVDPRVCEGQTSGKWLFGPPAKLLLNQPIVRIAAPDPKWSRYMPFLELLAGDGHNAVGKLIDRHHLVGADVQWSREPRAHQPDRAFDAFRHIQEGSGLLAIAPNVDRPSVWRHCDLAAKRSRRFLTAALPRSRRAEDVVIASDPDVDPTTTSESKIKPLAEELFPPVLAIWGRGVSGTFLAVWRVRVCLVVGRIHARG